MADLNTGRQKFNPPWLAIFSYSILVFLMLPVIIMVPMSFESQRFLEFPPRGFSLQWYDNFFSNASWLSATATSFKVGVIVAILSTFLGTMASFCFVRKDFRGKELLYGLVLSPMIMPVIVFAIAVYFFFADIQLIGSFWGVVFAHTVLASPFVIVIVTASLQGFDRNLERAAMNLGATRLVTFFKITLPMIRPGMLTGALLAFLTSFDEVVVAIFICGVNANTLPKKMWESITMETDPTITAIATMLITLNVTLLLGIELYRRRILKKHQEGH